MGTCRRSDGDDPRPGRWPPPTRASQDVDILGNLTASSTTLRTIVTAVRDLGFEPEPSIDGKRLHRFVRTTDNQVIDILAPDHSPPLEADDRPTTADHPDRRGQPGPAKPGYRHCRQARPHLRRACAQHPGIPHPQGSRVPGRQPGPGTSRRRCSVPRVPHH
jgi:hypothetical protein